MNLKEIYTAARADNADRLYAAINDLRVDRGEVDLGVATALNILARHYEHNDYTGEQFCSEVINYLTQVETI